MLHIKIENILKLSLFGTWNVAMWFTIQTLHLLCESSYLLVCKIYKNMHLFLC